MILGQGRQSHLHVRVLNEYSNHELVEERASMCRRCSRRRRRRSTSARSLTPRRTGTRQFLEASSKLWRSASIMHAFVTHQGGARDARDRHAPYTQVAAIAAWHPCAESADLRKLAQRPLEYVFETFRRPSNRLQDKDSLMDSQGAQEEPEGRPGGTDRGKGTTGDPP